MKGFVEILCGVFVMVGCYNMGKYFPEMPWTYELLMWFVAWILLRIRDWVRDDC